MNYFIQPLDPGTCINYDDNDRVILGNDCQDAAIKVYDYLNNSKSTEISWSWTRPKPNFSLGDRVLMYVSKGKQTLQQLGRNESEIQRIKFLLKVIDYDYVPEDERPYKALFSIIQVFKDDIAEQLSKDHLQQIKPKETFPGLRNLQSGTYKGLRNYILKVTGLDG